MSITNQFNRQYARTIVVDIGIKNIGAGNETKAKLPQGTLLQSVQFVTVVAFNSATTATGTVTDGTTVFVNAVDLKTVGSETVANAPKFYPAGGELTFSAAETGAGATAGRALAVVTYVSAGGGDEVYGPS